MYCYKCGQKQPDGSVFCPYCGTRITENRNPPHMTSDAAAIPIEKQPKRRGKWWIAFFVGLMVIVLIVAVAFGSRGMAIMSVATNHFSAAEIYLELTKGTDRYDEQLAELIEAGLDFESGQIFSGYTRILRMAEDGYALAEKVLKDITPTAYKIAAIMYQSREFTDAKVLFLNMKDYERTEDYLLLLRARSENEWSSVDYEALLSLIDFENTKELLLYLPDVANEFLRGEWKTEDGKYFFKRSENEFIHNLPYDAPEGWNHQEIYQGQFFLSIRTYSTLKPQYYEDKQRKSILELTVLDEDTIEVLCKKTGETYTMHRQ